MRTLSALQSANPPRISPKKGSAISEGLLSIHMFSMGRTIRNGTPTSADAITRFQLHGNQFHIDP